MSATGRDPYRLIAYELLADHGFALPLYAEGARSNALHVAVPTIPGEPRARIAAFHVHAAEAVVMLEDRYRREVSVGDEWVDVLLWAGSVYVGSRCELWEKALDVRAEIARDAPLTMLSFVEGTGQDVAAFATAAHDWLERDWGSAFANRWRMDGYLRQLAIRDVRRFLHGRNLPGASAMELAGILVRLHGDLLEATIPASLGRFLADDLRRVNAAAASFGWSLVVLGFEDPVSDADEGEDGNVLLMRLRHGRGATQTQIPFRVFDTFFERDRVIRNPSGRRRSMTQSMSKNRRNTMKLQLPEIARMRDPLAKFERRDGTTFYEIHDGGEPAGAEIAESLAEGLKDGTTQQTRGGATWWRAIPKTS